MLHDWRNKLINIDLSANTHALLTLHSALSFSVNEEFCCSHLEDFEVECAVGVVERAVDGKVLQPLDLRRTLGVHVHHVAPVAVKTISGLIFNQSSAIIQIGEGSIR